MHVTEGGKRNVDVIRIALLGLVIAFTAVALKGLGGSYGFYVALAGCLVIFWFSLSRLMGVIQGLEEIQQKIGMGQAYLEPLIKIVGITYVSELVASICRDAGHSSVAAQVEAFGKLSILTLCLPVLRALLKTIESLLGGG